MYPFLAKYTFNTKLPSPTTTPLSTFAASSSYSNPSSAVLSSAVTDTSVSVVPSLSSLLVASFEYVPSVFITYVSTVYFVSSFALHVATYWASPTTFASVSGSSGFQPANEYPSSGIVVGTIIFENSVPYSIFSYFNVPSIFPCSSLENIIVCFVFTTIGFSSSGTTGTSGFVGFSGSPGTSTSSFSFSITIVYSSSPSFIVGIPPSGDSVKYLSIFPNVLFPALSDAIIPK